MSFCATLCSACHSNAGVSVPGVGRKNISRGLSAGLSRDGVIRREGDKHLSLRSFDFSW